MATEQQLIEKSAELLRTQKELADATQLVQELIEYKQDLIDIAKKRMGRHWNDEFENLPAELLSELTKVEKISIVTDSGVSGESTKIRLSTEEQAQALLMYPNTSREKAYEYYEHNLMETGKMNK